MENFERTERSLTKEEVSEFEQKNSLVLPESFIDHFLKNNGGFPPYNYVDGEEEVFSIDGFIPFKYGKTTIEALLKDYSRQGIVFKNKLPFANDSGGNLFFIFLNIDAYGEIYLWEADGGIDDEDSYIFVCKSFDDFIKGLTNEEPDDE